MNRGFFRETDGYLSMTAIVHSLTIRIGPGSQSDHRQNIRTGTFSAMDTTTGKRCSILRRSRERFRCLLVLHSASGGRGTGRTLMKSSKIWSLNSGCTTFRSMCSSLTWTGTKHLIYGGGVRRKIRQVNRSDGPDTRGTGTTFRIPKASLPGAIVKD